MLTLLRSEDIVCLRNNSNGASLAAGHRDYTVCQTYVIMLQLIASQAMITATFSLVQQLVNMKSLPPYVAAIHRFPYI